MSVYVSHALVMRFDMAQERNKRRSLIKEVSAQFIGSDLETGYTFIYTWLANQFGHYMIGFAGTLALIWVVSFFGLHYVLHPQTLSEAIVVGGFAAAWLLFWIFKEYRFDVVGGQRDLRDAKERRQKLNKQRHRDSPRKRPTAPGASDEASEAAFKRDLRRDSLTDIWFYSAGVLTTLTMLLAPALATAWERPWLAGGLPLATFFVLLAISGWISAKWLWRNIAFDKAQLPFVTRYALTDRPFEKETREAAIEFVLNNEAPGHLLVIGPPKSGRTTTAIALAVEALLQASPPRNIVRYITLCKLLDRIAEGKQDPKLPRPVFPPEEAELLIIDDVGAQNPHPMAPLVTAGHFKVLFEGLLGKNDTLKAAGQNKRVIWVVGDDPGQAEQWQNALDVFGPGTCVETVKLDHSIPPSERRRPTQHAKAATHGHAINPFANLLARGMFFKSRPS